MAEEDKVATTKITETLDETSTDGAPLTKKRTRDDFEEGLNEGEETKQTERKIASIKRRRDAKDGSDGTAVKISEAVVKEGDNEKKKEVTEVTEEAETSEENDQIASKNEKEDKADPVEVTKPEETKEDSKDENKDAIQDELPVKQDEKKKEEAPKFVFGYTTAFGANAFSLLNKNKNVFDSSSSTKEAPKASSSGTPPVFGSNSKFGNALQSAVSKNSIFDKTPEEASNENEDASKSRDTTPIVSGNLYKQVDLEKKEIKSGEEDEDHVFTCRAKLYALNLANVKEGWKERGVGNIHVNRAKEAGKNARIIMRSIGLLKVILNTPLVEGLEVSKGMPSSLASEKFIRITIVENSKPVQYALKTGNPETTTSLYDAIVNLIPKSV